MTLRREKILTKILGLCLWVFSLLVFAPLALIIINSLKSPAEADAMSLALPQAIQWQNYADVLSENDVFRSFLNSTFITCTSVALSVILGTMAAFVLSRNRNRLNRVVHSFFLLGLVVPVQIITLIEVLKTLRMQNTYQGIILVYAAMFLPLSLFLAYSFISSIPKELDEAAVVDGCRPLRLFFRVLFPLLTPVVVTSAITQFMFIWNDFQYPLYLLSDTKKWTLVLGVYGFLGQYSTSWNLVCAHILVSSLPIVLVYLLGQKYIISGMVAGAVKG